MSVWVVIIGFVNVRLCLNVLVYYVVGLLV